ncbi:NPC intracellular cholesterol transporter 2-like isoform X2 [Haliotis rubra]|uniref:NPC intracellular cholesterol transporter 2-like isoform X2 n=1 Tax=Haliotis rubra TaxID=36100 RepID=UPI001EE5E911|nr:NPC intracellular cholesterol transporter 2-like isoform X2 [Haliotis rubra]
MNVLLCIAVCATLLFVAQAESINFKNCDANGTVTSMDVAPCPVQPCVFHKGDNATVKICFTAPASSNNLTAEIDGVVAGIPVKFPMPNPNGCYQSGIGCPISKGQTYCYTNNLAVLPSYPSIRLVVKWSLFGDDKVPEFCVLFPVEIDGAGRDTPTEREVDTPSRKDGNIE